MNLKLAIRSKFFRVVTGLILILVAGYAAYRLTRPNQNELIVALIGPMSGPDIHSGVSMQQGAKLLIDQVNQNGGVNGKTVRLVVYDDQNRPELAKEMALLAVESNALVVLGHESDATALAGGEIYQQHGLTAITGSATFDKVTEDNPWYYRVIFNNQTQAIFLANYLIKILGQEKASIIYNREDALSQELLEPFVNTFTGLGGIIQKTWYFEAPSANQQEQLDQIVTEMLQSRQTDPGMIFLATKPPDAKEIIVQMRRKGLPYPIVGSISWANTSFGRHFEQYPEERVTQGYFTNGIYTLSPMLFDVAGEKAEDFSIQFNQAYGHPPDWIAATYYDAALTAIDALRDTQTSGDPNRIEAERLQIRDHLAELDRTEHAIAGVTGKIYFDRQGNAEKPVPVGIFDHGFLTSAATQFLPVYDESLLTNLAERLDSGQIAIVNGSYVYQTRVVYTGIDLIEISDIDLKDSTFTADFYIWFRYQGELDAENIQFGGSQGNVELGDPIFDETIGAFHYRAYRVKTEFNNDFNYHNYPFDRQNLRIDFRHKTQTRQELIYVVDLVGLGENTPNGLLNKLERNQVFPDSSTWQPTQIHFYQDTLRTNSSLGNPRLLDADFGLEYSHYNAIIEVERDVFSFAAKNLLPLAAVIVLSYVSVFLQPDQLAVKNAIGRGALLTVAFFHIKLSSDLPGIGYTVKLDTVFYWMYLLIVAEIILTMITRRAFEKGQNQQVQRYLLAGKIVYPIAVLTLGIWFFSHYQGYNWPLNQITAQDEAETAQTEDPPPNPDQPQNSSGVTLRLGSWRVDDMTAMEKILTAFHARHPEIEVVFEPSLNYYQTLDSQLDGGAGPDLYYVGSYSYASGYIENNHLAPLDDLPGLSENFSAAARLPWEDDTGRLYAVPMMSTYLGVYYNHKIFTELGLGFPKTWDELIETAETIRQAGYLPFANTSGSGWAARTLLFWNIAPNFIGGPEGRLAYARGERCFNDEHVVDAYQAVADLIPYLPENHAELGYYDSMQLFLSGEAAMWMGGSWDLLAIQMADPGFVWSVFAPPPPKGQPGYVVYAPDFGIGLNTASAYPDEARIFLAWLTSPEAAALFANELLGFFTLHNQAPELNNPQASAFQNLALNHKTDTSWAIFEGLPSGSALMEAAALGVLHAELTPQEAADQLQTGLAAWYVPAQICGQQSRSE